MRWKWKLGLLAILVVEVPVLLWAGIVLEAPAQVVVYLGGVLAAVLLGILALRPILFVLAGGWALGVAAVAWSVRPYAPATVALGLGALVSTVASAIGWPVTNRVIRLALHRGVLRR